MRSAFHLARFRPAVHGAGRRMAVWHGWLLALCLCGAQLAGFWHGVAHAPLPAAAHIAAALGAAQGDDGLAGATTGATSGVTTSGAHHCLLFDALTLGSFAGPSLPSLPVSTAGLPPDAAPVAVAARVAAPGPFRSRAPPPSLG